MTLVHTSSFQLPTLVKFLRPPWRDDDPPDDFPHRIASCDAMTSLTPAGKEWKHPKKSSRAFLVAGKRCFKSLRSTTPRADLSLTLFLRFSQRLVPKDIAALHFLQNISLKNQALVESG
jgi:hypothetical protein